MKPRNTEKLITKEHLGTLDHKSLSPKENYKLASSKKRQIANKMKQETKKEYLKRHHDDLMKYETN